MTTLTAATGTFYSTCTGPSGGGARTAASVNTPLQTILDNTGYLKNLFDSSNGVKRIRRYTTVSAAKAATGFADGDTAVVTGAGVYLFSASSTVTGDDRWVLTVTSGGRLIRLGNGVREADTLSAMQALTGLVAGDLVLVPGTGLYRVDTSGASAGDGYWELNWTAGTGYFQRVEIGLILTDGGASGAEVRLDPGKAPVPNRLVSVATGIAGGATDSANTTNGYNIASVTDVDVEVGDYVMLTGFISELEATTQDLTVRLLEGTTVIGTVAYVRAGEKRPISWKLIRTIPGAGSGTFSYNLNILSNSSTSNETHTNCIINAEVVRPLWHCQPCSIWYSAGLDLLGTMPPRQAVEMASSPSTSAMTRGTCARLTRS